jgi:hypothetical protein
MSLGRTALICDRGAAPRRPWHLGAMVICLWLVAGCGATERDLSRDVPYSAMVGRTYQIVGDVDAVAIRRRGETEPAYLILDPRPSVTGPEVAFTQPLERGTRFRIVGAGVFDTILDDTTYYLVEWITPDNLPTLPVHLNISDDDNLSGTSELSARLYERLK